MSRDNYIVCMDCGEWLVLGKHVRIHNKPLDKTIYGFAFTTDGHRDDYENMTKQGLDLMHRTWRYLEHFLMRHRGHELRVLPYELVGPYENDLFPQYAPGDPAGSPDYVPKENYYLSPTGVPDQDLDAKLVPESVVRRLEEMSRGENLAEPVWDQGKVLPAQSRKSESRLFVSFDEDDYGALNDIARRREISVASVIRQALAGLIQTERNQTASDTSDVEKWPTLRMDGEG